MLASPVKMKMIKSIGVLQRSPRNAGPIRFINIELNCKYKVGKKGQSSRNKFRWFTRVPIVSQRSLLNGPVSAREGEVGGGFWEKGGGGVYVNWRLSILSTVWEVLWPDIVRICKRVRAWLQYFWTFCLRCSLPQHYKPLFISTITTSQVQKIQKIIITS